MRIQDVIKIVNRNLWRYKLRSFLTMSAVFIGAFTLAMTNGFGDGLRNFVEKNTGFVDTGNTFIVHQRLKIERRTSSRAAGEQIEYRETTGGEDGSNEDAGNIKIYSEESFGRIAADIPNIQAIEPDFSIKGEYLTIENGKKFSLVAVPQQTGAKYPLFAGETIKGKREIILPLPIAKAIDENANDVVGKSASVTFKNRRNEAKTFVVTVVGISPKGFFGSIVTYIDLDTSREVYDWQKEGYEEKEKFYTFFVRPNTEDQDSLNEIKNRFNEKNFEAVTLAEQKQTIFAAIDVFKMCLNSFAIIALLAACCGITNTLIIAVWERTTEIGLSRALGLSKWKIFVMFTLESAFVGFWGAVLGIVAAFVVGSATAYFVIEKFGKTFEGYQLVHFSARSIFGIIFLVVFLSVLAGTAPAWRASRLNPIDALKGE